MAVFCDFGVSVVAKLVVLNRGSGFWWFRPGFLGSPEEARAHFVLRILL